MVEVGACRRFFATLDERGCLDGLPFMPEMAAFCGHRFPVHRRLEKVWEYAHGTGCDASITPCFSKQCVAMARAMEDAKQPAS